MGYLIQYDPSLNKKYRIKKIRKPDKRILLTGCALISVILLSLIPAVRQWLWEFLIPGDPQVTTAAFSEFVTDVQEGQQLKDAVTTFCKEILSHG